MGDDDGGSAHLPESDANLKNPNLWSSFRFFRGTLSSLRLPSEYGTVFQSGFPIAAAHPLKEPQTYQSVSLDTPASIESG